MSLYRLLVPFVVVGLLFTGIFFYVNEKIGPKNAYWCDQFIRGLKFRETPDLHLVRNHPLKNEVAHRIWLVGQFNEITYEMNDVQIIQEREDGSYQTEYNAKSAAWMDDLWWFENMTIQQYDEDSNPMGRPAERRAMEIPGLSETPKDFLAGIRKEQTFMSARDLATFVNARPNLSKRGQARYLTDLHYRLAIPWACLVMTLVGIPTGGQTGWPVCNEGQSGRAGSIGLVKQTGRMGVELREKGLGFGAGRSVAQRPQHKMDRSRFEP